MDEWIREFVLANNANIREEFIRRNIGVAKRILRREYRNCTNLTLHSLNFIYAQNCRHITRN
jgi:hypothetical protein